MYIHYTTLVCHIYIHVWHIVLYDQAHPEVVHGDSERVHDLSINGLILQIYQVHLLTNLWNGG